MLTSSQIFDFMYVCHNIDRWDLEKIGCIQEGSGGDNKWTRFNNDLDVFVLKLTELQRKEFTEFVNERIANLDWNKK